MQNEVTPLIMVLFGIACFLVGFSKAGVGGATGFLMTPLLSLVLPVKVVVGLLLPVLMIGDVFTLAVYWHRWRVSIVRILLVGALAGVALAMFVLVNTSGDILKKGLAIMAIAFVIYRLLERRLLSRMAYNSKPWHALLGGSVGGFASTLANAGGPPITIYLLLQRFDPPTFIATSALFFGVLNWIKLPLFLAGGLIDVDLLRSLLWLTPLVPVGVWVGRKMVKVINREAFDALILFFLAISAIFLLV
jgi:uncharacterized protein